MMKKLLCTVLLAVALIGSAHAAVPQMGIVAVVNDDAITSNDLEGRVRLAMLGSGIEPTPEIMNRLSGQILRSLIDESLQRQEAKRLNVTVDEKDVDSEMAKLAEQNRIPPAKLPEFFARQGVPVEALRSQIRVNLMWSKVVQRKLRSQVDISDADVDDEIARLQANAGKPEYLLAEIFLPVANPQQAPQVEQVASKLIQQMAQGVRFSAVARQFSQSATAAAGGDLGWVRPGQMEPQLDEALAKMTPGTLSPPIRTAGGYHILMLREQRLTPRFGAPSAQQSNYALRQVLVPLAPNASKEALATASAKLADLRKQAKSCTDMARLAKAQGDNKEGDLGTMKYADIPPALQNMVAGLPESEPSPPLRNERGVLFIMVCSRTAQPGVTGAEVNRESITNQLGMQRLELLARRYMRDLRLGAFIDIRQPAAQPSAS